MSPAPADTAPTYAATQAIYNNAPSVASGADGERSPSLYQQQPSHHGTPPQLNEISRNPYSIPNSFQNWGSYHYETQAGSSPGLNQQSSASQYTSVHDGGLPEDHSKLSSSSDSAFSGNQNPSSVVAPSSTRYELPSDHPRELSHQYGVAMDQPPRSTQPEYTGGELVVSPYNYEATFSVPNSFNKYKGPAVPIVAPFEQFSGITYYVGSSISKGNSEVVEDGDDNKANQSGQAGSNTLG